MDRGTIPESIASHQDELRRLCARNRVKRLDLFGSATGERFDSRRSDFDFLVVFLQPMTPAEHVDCYFDLKEDLEKLFGRPVDLLEPGPIRNPYLIRSIEESRVSLYAA